MRGLNFKNMKKHDVICWRPLHIEKSIIFRHWHALLHNLETLSRNIFCKIYFSFPFSAKSIMSKPIQRPYVTHISNTHTHTLTHAHTLTLTLWHTHTLTLTLSDTHLGPISSTCLRIALSALNFYFTNHTTPNFTSKHNTNLCSLFTLYALHQ